MTKALIFNRTGFRFSEFNLYLNAEEVNESRMDRESSFHSQILKGKNDLKLRS